TDACPEHPVIAAGERPGAARPLARHPLELVAALGHRPVVLVLVRAPVAVVVHRVAHLRRRELLPLARPPPRDVAPQRRVAHLRSPMARPDVLALRRPVVAWPLDPLVRLAVAIIIQPIAGLA